MTRAATKDAPGFVQFTPEQLQLSSGTPVGAGAISQVVQTRLKGTHHAGLPVVVKILSKVQLLQQHKVESAMQEKAALLKLSPHPFIARLYGTAQSDDELYFVMECLPHGDLLQHIRRSASKRVQEYSAAHSAAEREGEAPASPAAPAAKLVPIPVSSSFLRCLDFNDIRLITAQLVLALSHTYQQGVILRDLKPENIVFDDKYRACLIDFDTADVTGMAILPESNNGVALKEASSAGDQESAAAGAAPPPSAKRLSVSDIQNMRKKTASFCGTAQYVSPEMVGECKWSFSSDLWALGTTVYEMLYGVHMFSGLGPFEVLQKVVKGVASTEHPVPFPFVHLGGCGSSGTTAAASSHDLQGDGGFAAVKDFILRLVNIDPAKRLGVHPTSRGFDLDAFKRHELFADFDWSVLESQLETFSPRTFPRRASADGGGDGQNEDNADRSPSLKELYHRVPYNDPSYAGYVYKATADANPFERYMKHIILDGVTEEESANANDASATEGTVAVATIAGVESGGSSNTTTTAPPSSTPSNPPLRYTHDDDDDTMDIIDDVGMNYHGMEADEDFRQ